MPQILLLIAAGAGLYSGYKWVAREVARATDAAARADQEVRRRTSHDSPAPKDLGSLEWDEEAGAYRPKRQ